MIDFIKNIFTNKYKRSFSKLLSVIDYRNVFYYSENMIIVINEKDISDNNLEGYYDWGEIYKTHIRIIDIDVEQITEVLKPLISKKKKRILILEKIMK